MRGPGFGRSVGTGRNPSTEKPRAALVPSLITQALLLARPEQWERGLAQTPSRQGQAHDMEACTWPPSSLASLAHPDHGSDQAAGWLRGGGGRETAVRAQSRI